MSTVGGMRVRGGHAWQGVCKVGGGMPGDGSVRGRKNVNYSGWYESHWNAYFFSSYFQYKMPFKMQFLLCKINTFNDKENCILNKNYSKLFLTRKGNAHFISKATLQ